MFQLQLQPWLFLLFALTLQLSLAAKFTLVNKCNYTIWPALVSDANATLSTSGFMLRGRESYTIPVPTRWNGHIWGHTLCTINSTTKKFSCVTDDCDSSKVECSGKGVWPLATLVKINLDNMDGQALYQVSLEEGFNVPMMVVPVGVPSNNCSRTGCPKDLNRMCLPELRVEEKRKVVACENACAAFNYTVKIFCCIGELNSCEPNVYAAVFKKAYPKAFNLPYIGDNTTTFKCSSTYYNIIFCPTIGGNGSNHYIAFIAVTVVLAIILVAIGVIILVMFKRRWKHAESA